MPLVSQTFDQLLDFTRTSAATFVGSNGLIQTTPASRNLLTWTQQFDNAVWNKEASTATANATTAPDGTSTADKVAATATTAFHSVRQFITGTVASYTYSVYAKASEYSKLILANATAGTWSATFDLATGATIATGGTAVLSSSIQSVGDGWYRCAVTFTGAAASTAHAAVGYPNTGATLNNFGAQYTGDGTSGIFLWGAQLEAVPDANLVLGSELRGTGTVGLVGTATAASYNTGTGAGAVTRVDASNQSYVEFTGLTNAQVYRVVVSCGTGSLSVRGGLYTDSVVATLTAGQSVTVYVTASSNRITVTNAPVAGSSTFTLTSIREYLGVTGMPSTYTRNNGGVFPPRFDYDPVTLAAKGLLVEEQRTNLALRSEEFDNASWNKFGTTVTANAAVSPDGASDADALVEDATTGSHICQQFLAYTSGTAYTFSTYVKAGTRTWVQIALPPSAFTALTGGFFNLTGAGSLGVAVGTPTSRTITAVGNGWYRITVTATATATASGNTFIGAGSADGTSSYAGVAGAEALYLYGAQLEAGAFATSYIPTVASQVTRTADICTIVAPNFAPWYNQSEGSWVASFSPYAVAGGVIIQIGAATNADRFQLLNDNASQIAVQTSNVGQGTIDAGTLSAGATNNLAYAYRTNDTAASLNGGAAVADNTVALPVVDRLSIGSTVAPANFLNGHVRSIRYYPTRLSNAQLQALTA